MSLDDSVSLSQDGALFEPLSRVAYRHGMMLGVEAVRDEQAYHKRRLNRHQYWLHGAGTLVGLAVSLEHQEADADDTRDQALRLLVSPGIALDGLGREVVLGETYCLDLRAWIESQREETTREWSGSSVHVPEAGALWLDIVLRAADCDRGLQPVVAHEVNAGIDPVATSRIEQAVQLDLTPVTLSTAERDAFFNPAAEPKPLPGAAHPGAPADLDNLLTDTERSWLDALSGARGDIGRLHADRLFRLGASELDPERLADALRELSNVMLARIQLLTLDDTKLVSHPARVRINNLLRPFVTNPDLLRWVMTNPSTDSD